MRLAHRIQLTPDPARVEANRGYIAFLISEFTVPHLLNTYKAFKGDLVMAIVLGEIGQHNVRRYFRDPRFRPGSGAERALQSRVSQRPLLNGCNALSISRATGLARETVRRKVVKLLRRGLIERDARGQLTVVPDIAQQFSRFNDATLESYLDVAAALDEVLGRTRAEDTPRDATRPRGRPTR